MCFFCSIYEIYNLPLDSLAFSIQTKSLDFFVLTHLTNFKTWHDKHTTTIEFYIQIHLFVFPELRFVSSKKKKQTKKYMKQYLCTICQMFKILALKMKCVSRYKFSYMCKNVGNSPCSKSGFAVRCVLEQYSDKCVAGRQRWTRKSGRGAPPSAMLPCHPASPGRTYLVIGSYNKVDKLAMCY